MEPATPKKDRIVLDTSLFVNPDIRLDFGNSPTDAITGFLRLARQVPSLEFYMPTSIFAELVHFVNMDSIPDEFLAVIRQKPPDRYGMSCPSLLLYELIDEMRNRVNKGLRIAEKAVRNAGRQDEREVIQDLRKNYRVALREGIIDSKEDVDLIILARELDGLLVTADQGAILWAEKMGIRWLPPTRFKGYLLTSIETVKTER